MSVLTLPQSMVRDRENGIKANATHVDENFTALETAVNGKLDLDGTSVPTTDISMGGNKLTNLGSPSVLGDAATKGYVDNADLLKANLSSPAFTGTPTAPTAANNQWDYQIATTGFVKNVLSAMWPVGAIYLDTTNANVCPLQAFFGTWTLVGTDRALWGGNGWNGNSLISAGLPNIEGYFGLNGQPDAGIITSGAFSDNGKTAVTQGGIGGVDWRSEQRLIRFSARNSNYIYGSSSTVQPAAYRVNVWRRTA